MKYVAATFKNYIGFFNGMSLNEVSIDFTKCKHNIILISGMNGSGKSTLLFHLNPFPDGSSSFIPEKSAEKDLVLDNNGDIYSIQIYSPVDLKGRKTTKAYIQKNGVELNENGNVSTYKDIIFSEFELDSNYISLSRLSSTDRGLGDKTPAERKRFVANIIENLEIYNSMYKTLNKKSLIYKSHTNTLHTKIQNIGSKEMIDSRLRTLKAKEKELSDAIMNFNNQIVAIQAKNSIDEEEAKAIKQANDIANTLKEELDAIQTSLDIFFNKTKIKKEDIISKYEKDKELQSTYASKMSELKAAWLEKSQRLTTVSDNISSLEAELYSANIDDDIGTRYSENRKAIKEIEDSLKGIVDISDKNLVVKLTKLNEFADKFIKLIDVFYDNITSEDINLISKDDIKSLIAKSMNLQSELMSNISSKKEELSKLNADIKTLSILEERPKNCKIDSCPFISEAIALKKNTKGDILKKLDKVQNEILKLSDRVTDIQSKIDHMSQLTGKDMELRRIIELVGENKAILDEFYPRFILGFINSICNVSTFGDIRDNSKYNDALNMMIILEDLRGKDKLLEVEYNGYKDKIKLINSSKSMIEKLKEESKELIESTTKLKSEYTEYENTYNQITSNIDIEYQYKEAYSGYLEKLKDYTTAQAKVDEYNKKSSKALEALTNIDQYRASIDNINRELNPIKSDISTLEGQLTLLESYYIEYNNYKSSYDRIEILKKYCSPTGGGIQTLFIQLYMSKTKQLANEVLGMLFNGIYHLQDFIINETEFRIPFIGEGLPVDDISSGSASQIAMMSLIINLVLLHQASTKFNIAFLDEIESALDGYNRTNFVNVLFHSINILGIEQLFLISHSIEVDNTFADIIQLKGYDNFDSIATGNVIWDYKEVISQT